ncbi:MAG: flavin reductase [Eubacteriales bacterium]|nr:flavin reductase [Eubacteriales bacterium]
MSFDPKAMFKLSYGLFVLSARQDGKDNGCIINTVTQITDEPKRVALAVQQRNLTHDMIRDTGEFNVSVLSEQAEFSLFQRFGFQSGRNADKLAGFAGYERSDNGLIYLTQQANALISGRVIASTDYGTHTLFVADVTDLRVLSEVPSATYAYYFANIKPKPEASAKKVKGYRCKICGYVYEGDTLPADFICPWCGHPASDFEPIE